MATVETGNQNSGSQGSSNNLTGSGNWNFTDGQWQSSEGATLTDTANSFASGGGAGGGDNASGGASAFGAGGGNPLAGGGNTSNSNGESNYTRPADEGGLADGNNPFNQLLGVLGGGSSSSSDGNPLAGGSNSASGGGASSEGSNSASGGNLPGNLPFGDNPPGAGDSPLTNGTVPLDSNSSFDGKPVPNDNQNWISSLNAVSSDTNATGNTGSGNGNWNLGSDNTTNGNGNWNFASGNSTSGNGNWNYTDGNSTSGNGNWGFGTGNSTGGNGNWNVGSDNSTVGNANTSTGSDSQILGSGNTSSADGSNITGNRIDSSQVSNGAGNSIVGNEGWAFAVTGSSNTGADSLLNGGANNTTSDSNASTTSNQIDFVSQGVGAAINTNVGNLLNSPDLIAAATSNSTYTNPQGYDFSGVVA